MENPAHLRGHLFHFEVIHVEMCHWVLHVGTGQVHPSITTAGPFASMTRVLGTLCEPSMASASS